VSRTLAQMELVRQVAAADVNRYGSRPRGEEEGGACRLGGVSLELLGALKREAEMEVARVSSQDSPFSLPLPISSPPPTASLPRSDVPVARIQQQWRPVSGSATLAAVKDPAASSRQQWPWHELRRPRTRTTVMPEKEEEKMARRMAAAHAAALRIQSGLLMRTARRDVAQRREALMRSRANGALRLQCFHRMRLGKREAQRRLSERAKAKKAAMPMSQLASLLLEAAELTDWFPASDHEKLHKASVLVDQVPRLLCCFEDFIIDKVLQDTALELTRIDCLKGLRLCGNSGGGDARDKNDFSAYVEHCADFEDDLLRKYSFQTN